MYEIQYIKGDIIKLAKSGKYDVVVHGCNCFCRQKRGLAPQMVKAFKTNTFDKEAKFFEGDTGKLGTIDYKFVYNKHHIVEYIAVVNAYTQYHWANSSVYGIPLDYDALSMCMARINSNFKGQKILLPKIGCGLAGGDWDKVENIIKQRLTNCDTTIVKYNQR